MRAGTLSTDNPCWILAGIVAIALGWWAVPGGRRRKIVLMTAACALLFGGAVVVFLLVGPRDYLATFPRVAAVLHPYLLAFYAGVAFVVAGGLLLGIVLRSAVDWAKGRR